MAGWLAGTIDGCMILLSHYFIMFQKKITEHKKRAPSSTDTTPAQTPTKMYATVILPLLKPFCKSVNCQGQD